MASIAASMALKYGQQAANAARRAAGAAANAAANSLKANAGNMVRKAAKEAKGVINKGVKKIVPNLGNTNFNNSRPPNRNPYNNNSK